MRQARRLDQLDQVAKRGEEHLVAGLEGLDAQGARQVRLAYTGGTQKEHDRGRMKERPDREFTNQAFRERRLETEVARLKAMTEEQRGRLETAPVRSLLPACDLCLKHLSRKRLVGELSLA